MRHAFVGMSAAALCLAVGASSRCARAQEEGGYRQGTPPPTPGLELKVGTGYTQGFGKLTPSQGVGDVGGAGIAVDLEAGGRIDPRWSVGVEAEYQELTPNLANTAAARGAAGNVGVSWHAAPDTRGDPWLRVGSGARLLWSVDPRRMPTQLVYGLELAKVVVGYDVRLAPDLALGPVVGADVDVFGWQYQGGWSTALTAPQVGTFVFAGVQGRFDLARRPPAAR